MVGTEFEGRSTLWQQRQDGSAMLGVLARFAAPSLSSLLTKLLG